MLLFGVFRYTTRTLLLHAGLMLLGYGVVIFLHWHGRPAGADLLVDVARWLTLATVLPLFTLDRRPDHGGPARRRCKGCATARSGSGG